MTNEGITISLSQFNHMCEELEELREYKNQQQEKIGKWIYKQGIFGAAYCSKCDFELKIDNTKYCPNCGCRMKEVSE